MVILTEALSLFRVLNRLSLFLAWLCACAVIIVISAVIRRQQRQGPAKAEPAFRFPRVRLAIDESVMLGGGLLIIVLVGVTAAVSPPNGSDQLQYHLPRVVAWASRHSVAFFPTHYYVQLFAPPLAEWMMLHSYLLTGGDRFVSLVQWLAFVGSAVVVSLIAKELGANRKGQLLAFVLSVTLPQGILAASGAKNDWVLSFWLAAVILFLFRWYEEPDRLNSAQLGIAVGAALLSKGSVYMFLPPIAAAIAVWRWRQWKAVYHRIPVVIALIVLMNGPQWFRNYSLGGSIVGLTSPDVAGKEKYTVDRVTVAGIASNVLRESAMQLESPIESFNQRTTNWTRWLISRLGVNPDDPAATNYGRFELPPAYYSHDEYYAGNPLHLCFLIGAFYVMLMAPKRAPAGGKALGLGLLAGFVLYCALFRWEIWCARLHLPLLVAASALIAVVVCQRFPKLVLPIGAVALIAALPPTLCNETRPLLFAGGFRNLRLGGTSILTRSRTDLYFTQQSQLRDTYISAAAAIRSAQCDDIGFDTSLKPYSHEYPLIELGKKEGQAAQFRYIDVNNKSSQYAGDTDLRMPCVVVCPDCRDNKQMESKYASHFPQAQVFGDLVIFSRGVQKN